MYGETLKNLREEHDLKQIDLAYKLNIDRSQYGHYEREYATIPIKHLNTLCNYFNVSMDYIFGFTTTKQYKNNNKEINKKESGNRLKELRKEYNINQTKLATFLNTTFTNISSYERGINVISTNYLYTICKKYHISADYLLGRTEAPKNLDI